MIFNKKINGRVLYILSEEQCLLFKNLSFYLVNLKSCKHKKIASMPVDRWVKLISRIRLVNRLKRLEPKCAGRLSERKFVICMFGKLWVLDIRTNELQTITNLRKGFSVLNFCEYRDSLYFGDYGINKSLDEINVYRLDSNLLLTTLYTFRPHQIRHIHNIICDNDRLWVLTGDNEPEAGIYYTDDDFRSIHSFALGSQKFRTVVAFPHKNGIIYASDSVEQTNYIYQLTAEGKMLILCEINGSCIYGSETSNYYIFSTTVESQEGTSIKALFSNKLGGGIKSKEVHVIAVDKNTLQTKVIAKFEKDCWPMKLFQYGRMIFPNGQQKSFDIWAYNVACRKIDGKTIKIVL